MGIAVFRVIKIMTIVVNIRKEKFDIYIGRNKAGVIPNPPDHGCYGNPFNLKYYTREESLRLYREYFNARIDADHVFRDAILLLRGKILGCFCKPLDCHGDVIVEWLNNNQA